MSGNQRRQSGILGIDLPFRNPQRSARSPIASMRHREHVNDNLRCAPGWPSSEYRSVRLPQLGRSESGRVQPADNTVHNSYARSNSRSFESLELRQSAEAV